MFELDTDVQKRARCVFHVLSRIVRLWCTAALVQFVTHPALSRHVRHFIFLIRLMTWENKQALNLKIVFADS
jgi:hypothetical protein